MGTVDDEALNGVYTLARYSTTYPMILDLTYPISERSGDDFVLNNVEIGSILVDGDEIFVSWYNHDASTYGVDKIDLENKLDGAYIVTKIIPVYRTAFANFTQFIVAYSSMPALCDLDMEYSTDYGVIFIPLDTTDDTDRAIISGDLSVEATQVMIKIIATVDGNDSPSFEAAGTAVS